MLPALASTVPRLSGARQKSPGHIANLDGLGLYGLASDSVIDALFGKAVLRGFECPLSEQEMMSTRARPFYSMIP